MRWPALVLVGIGRYVWLPVPLILLWPFLIPVVMLAWIGPLLLGTSGIREWLRVLRSLLILFAAMTGARVEVDPKDGPRIRMIVV